MIAQTLHKITSNAGFAIVASCAIVALSFFSFVIAEPQVGHSQTATSSFTIRQTITAEATFLVEPADVVMDGNINGVTGGNATGSSQFVVQSNSAGGHYVTIDFFDNAGQYTMLGDSTASEDIFDYNFGGAEPTFGFTPEVNASFGYTVISSSTLDTDNSFEYNGSTCNSVSSAADGSCWMTPSTSEFRIVDRSSPAPTGATSTIVFKVNVPAGATPVPAAESYTATATLSLYTQ